MANPLGDFSGAQPAVGPQGLQLLCQSLNSGRAERGIAERYFIVKKGGVETLELRKPDTDPVPFDQLGNRQKNTDFRLTQQQVDAIVAERGRAMSMMRDRGLIHKTPDGRFIPA